MKNSGNETPFLDWCAIHELNLFELESYIVRYSRRSYDEIPKNIQLPLSQKLALELCTTAIAKLGHPWVNWLAILQTRMLVEGHSMLDIGTNAGVTFVRENGDIVIATDYHGNLECLFTLMHELGHALHYIALEESSISINDVPAIPRETAAFIAERILVEYLKVEDMFSEYAEGILNAQRHRYFDSGCAELIECLLGTKELCSYSCAYPIAWCAAERAIDHQKQGSFSELSEWFVDTLKWKSILPTDSGTVHRFAKYNQTTAFNSYPFSYFRALGACLMLDLSLDNDIVNKSIKHYFSALVDARMSGAGLKLALDKANEPFGYMISDNRCQPARHDRVCSTIGSINTVVDAERVKEFPPRDEAADPTLFQDLYFKLGSMLRLLSVSEVHCERGCREYFLHEILPPHDLEQIEIIFDESHNPVGFVSWAATTDVALDLLAKGKPHLDPEDWNNGDVLLYNDFVAPWGHAKQLMQVVREKHQPLYGKARGIRRLPDGTLKRTALYR